MSTPINIAVVEDHDALREVMISHIEQMGHHVFGADGGESLDDLLASYTFDLLILDLNLPGEDGLSIAKRMRQAFSEIFIIMMTARNTEKDRIVGYEFGADIYLPKTTSLRELEAAISTIARRRSVKNASTQAIKLDVQKMCLIGSQEVPLGRSELILLKALAESPNQRLDYWRLLELIGKGVDDRSKSNLEVMVVRLRKKIALAGPQQESIRSLHKEGYQLICIIEIVK
jgi:DNA-binding response OmpR family regulator